MTRTLHRILTTIAWLVARVPAGWLPGLGAFIGLVAGRFLRYRRAHVESAMARASIPAPPSVANRMYQTLGLGLAELLWIGGHLRRRCFGHVDGGERSGAPEANGGLRGREPPNGVEATLNDAAKKALLEASAAGPVVIFASHTGNWELAAAAAAGVLRGLQKRLFVVAKTQHVSSVDAFVRHLRWALGVGVIAPEGASGAATRALARGDVVVLPIDQVPDRAGHALVVPFLGQPALVDRAPATLAFRAKATVLVAATSRGKDGLRVDVLKTIAVPDADARARDWIDRATIDATAALEAFVRSSPSDWLWLHRRWKELPAATPREKPRSLGFSENPG